MNTKKTAIRLAIAAGLSVGVLPHAFAAGTTAGTDVTNTASVVYTVGTVLQPTVNSNTTTFKVDRKVNLTVAEVGGAATVVVPGASAQVTTFTVTNTSNSTLDFRLIASQDSGGTAVFGGTDNFDVTGITAYVESGVTPGYQSTEDTATFIDELAADANKTVYVVGAIPAGRVNGDVAGVTLTAVAAQSTVGATGVYVATAGTLAADAAQTNTGVADDTTFIDTVFGDAVHGADIARNGRDSDRDQFNVVTAAIAVTKSSTVYSDPFNGTTNPKSVPGAIVEYCLDVNNTGSATATSIVLTDSIPANTTYVPGTIKIAATGTGAACNLGSGTSDDDGTTSPLANYNVTTAGAITVNTASIAAGARVKATFRVQVN